MRGRPAIGLKELALRVGGVLATVLGRDDNRLVLRTSMASFAIRAAGVVLATLGTVLMTRLMGAEEYGRVAFLLSGGFILVLFSGLGLPIASSKLVPRYLSRNDPDTAAHYFLFGNLLLAVTSLVVGCAFYLALEMLPSLFAGFAFSFFGTVGLIVTLALMRFVSESSRGFGFQFLGFLAENVISRSLLLVALMVVLALGFELHAWLALYLYVLAQGLTVAVVLFSMLRRIRPSAASHRPRRFRLYRAWIGTSSVMLITPVFYFLLFETDVMALGILSGPYEVGIYQVARRLAELTVFCSAVVSTIGLPRLARAHAERDMSRLQRTVDIINLIGVGSTMLVAMVLVLLGPWGLWIFGPEFDEGYPALLVLTIGRVLSVLCGPAGDMLLMTGHHRRLGRINLGFGLLNIVLNILLVPEFGALGAAFATSIASLGWSIRLYLLARRVSPIEPSVLVRAWRLRHTVLGEGKG